MLAGNESKAPPAERGAATASGNTPAKESAAPTLGRMQPPAESKLLAPKSEEDILEIPSFLRRQAN
jgi:hypothetical protein